MLIHSREQGHRELKVASSAEQSSSVPFSAVQRSAGQCNPVQCRVRQCHSMQCRGERRQLTKYKYWPNGNSVQKCAFLFIYEGALRKSWKSSRECNFLWIFDSECHVKISKRVLHVNTFLRECMSGPLLGVFLTVCRMHFSDNFWECRKELNLETGGSLSRSQFFVP